MLALWTFPKKNKRFLLIYSTSGNEPAALLTDKIFRTKALGISVHTSRIALGSHSLTKLHERVAADSLNILQNCFTWKANIPLSTSNSHTQTRVCNSQLWTQFLLSPALISSIHYSKRELLWLGFSAVSCSSPSGYSVRSRVRTWLNMISLCWGEGGAEHGTHFWYLK